MSAAAESALFCRSTFHYVNPNTGEGTQLVECDVHDGRRSSLPGWETCGFELRSAPAPLDSYDDDGEIEAAEYATLCEVAKRLTGCDAALISSHIKRDPDQAALHEDLAPIQYVHSDFAPSYLKLIHAAYGGEYRFEGSERALARAGITGADVANSRRIVILQFWRNIGPATMDLPIAFCDARSVAPRDVHAFPVQDYAGGGVDFETLGISPPRVPGAHAWYAFPEMTRDETVAFRTFDSEMAANGGAFWTPHSAFRDPRVELGQPARRSIELRATCVYL